MAERTDGKFIRCFIQGQNVDLQVDASAKPKFILPGLNEQKIRMKGQRTVEVRFEGQKQLLEIVVTKHTHTILLGWEWIQLGLNRNRLFVGLVDHLPSALEDLHMHRHLFRNELGKCEKVKAQMYLKNGRNSSSLGLLLLHYVKPTKMTWSTVEALVEALGAVEHRWRHCYARSRAVYINGSGTIYGRARREF